MSNQSLEVERIGLKNWSYNNKKNQTDKPASFGDDHLSAVFAEALPQFLLLQLQSNLTFLVEGRRGRGRHLLLSFTRISELKGERVSQSKRGSFRNWEAKRDINE